MGVAAMTAMPASALPPPTRRSSTPLRTVLPPIQVTTRRVRLTLGAVDETPPVGETVKSARTAAAVARAAIGSEITECVLVIFLNARNRVTGYSEVARGTSNAARLTPKDVFIPALYANAQSIVLAHNHPSGDCRPSFADRNVTRVIREAADLIGIRVVDHLIVTPSTNHSLASEDGWSSERSA
jgi:DNA repair protein RadC